MTVFQRIKVHISEAYGIDRDFISDELVLVYNRANMTNDREARKLAEDMISNLGGNVENGFNLRKSKQRKHLSTARGFNSVLNTAHTRIGELINDLSQQNDNIGGVQGGTLIDRFMTALNVLKQDVINIIESVARNSFTERTRSEHTKNEQDIANSVENDIQLVIDFFLSEINMTKIDENAIMMINNAVVSVYGFYYEGGGNSEFIIDELITLDDTDGSWWLRLHDPMTTYNPVIEILRDVRDYIERGEI